MKVTCNRAALYEAVQLAASIAPPRTPKPILQCAKLVADQESQKLTVIATDNEIMIRYVVPQVEIQAGGAAVIPADRITGILRESTEDTIEIEMVDATCQIVGKDSKFHIYGHDPDDFPEVSQLEADGGMEIKAGLLGRMISLTTFAAARENTRYAINGVLWEQTGQKLNLVATDGRRLAKANCSVKAGSDEQTGIVPIKTMQVLDRVLHDPDENVSITFSANQVMIRTALAEVSGNLMQGRFPKYQDVIPSGCDKKIALGTAALRSGVRRVALLTNEQSNGIKLTFDKGNLNLSSSAPEAGDAGINMDVEYDGAGVSIGFNPQYLLEMLRVVEQEQVSFEMSDASKPGLLRAGNDFLYVVMPVTV